MEDPSQPRDRSQFRDDMPGNNSPPIPAERGDSIPPLEAEQYSDRSSQTPSPASEPYSAVTSSHTERPDELATSAEIDPQNRNTTGTTESPSCAATAKSHQRSARVGNTAPYQELFQLSSLAKMQQTNKKLQREIRNEIKKCRKQIEELEKMSDLALEAGVVRTNVTTVLVVGMAGVGKTCTKNMLFGLKPPKVRDSTPLGDTPLRAVREVAYEKARAVNESEWKPLEGADVDKMVANTVVTAGRTLHGQPSKRRKNSKAEVEEYIKSITPLPFLDGSITESLTSSTSIENSDFVKMMETIRRHIGDIIASSAANQPGKDISADKILETLESDWIYFTDSGGQPHFHNLLPYFLHNISVILIVLRLSDKLEDHSTAEYFENGKRIGSYKSPLSIEDTLKCLAHSMQSLSGNGKKPKLIFIGTFNDQIHNDESINEKNMKLRKLFPSEEYKDQLMYSDPSKRALIYPINAKNPGDNEKKVTHALQTAIKHGVPPMAEKIPIRWYMLQVFLEYLGNALGRKTLSIAECLEVGTELKLDKAELTCALKLFHDLHLLHYYPHILPNLVFTSSQVLLDKLTELVKKAYEFRSDSTEPSSAISSESKLPFLGDPEKFLKGIITINSLKSFTAHFVDGIFGPLELLKLFSDLFIVAPFSVSVPRELSSTTIEESDQFFMPALLNMLPSADLDKHRSIDKVQPLVIAFPPRSGIFCCLQVHLIKEQKWDLVKIDGKPAIVAQNCVRLSHPQLPCNVTLIDSFSYIEVYVQTEHIYYLPRILKSIIDGIKAANEALNYSKDGDELHIQETFFCPCNRQLSRHIGNLRENYFLRCSIDQEYFKRLDDSYTVWLRPTDSGPLPYETILNVENHLRHVWEVVIDVKHDWKNLGRALGVSEVDLTTVEKASQYDPSENQSTANLHGTLKKWIETDQATMNKLLEVLEGRIIGQKDLANRIRAFTPEEKRKIGLD